MPTFTTRPVIMGRRGVILGGVSPRRVIGYALGW